MQLNTIKPADGAKHAPKRVGRGIGSGFGKTCGRGHKGQKSRSGGFNKLNFEGGQMPLHKRLPKFGFSSRVSRHTDEIRLHELEKMPEGVEINLETLQQYGLVNSAVKHVKIIGNTEVTKKLIVSGLAATKGAIQSIEAAGGKVES